MDYLTTSGRKPDSRWPDDEQLGLTVELLRRLIQAAGRKQTEVDAAIGRRLGYLSHVFQRRVDLKLRDLLGALQVLGVTPEAFFVRVHGQAPGSPARRGRGAPGRQELRRVVRRLVAEEAVARRPGEPG